MNFESFTPKTSGQNECSVKVLSNNPLIAVSNPMHDAAWNAISEAEVQRIDA
jgi:hypothetical protein